jgi:hypothetical protein
MQTLGFTANATATELKAGGASEMTRLANDDAICE